MVQPLAVKTIAPLRLSYSSCIEKPLQITFYARNNQENDMLAISLNGKCKFKLVRDLSQLMTTLTLTLSLTAVPLIIYRN